MRWTFVVAAGLVTVAAWEWSRQQGQVEQGEESADWITETYNTAADTVADWANMLTGYNPDKVPMEYRVAIAEAEQKNGIPAGMLARLLWQESRYRPAVISGAVRSPVGALGIAQFMPATAAELNINPLEPYQAIAGAGRYLAGLYRSVGSWDKALAAYNWGIGNVKRKGLEAAPLETRNYYRQILADLGLGGNYA